MQAHHHRKQQQGVTLVMVALWMGIALAALMVLDIGNLFWQKRELQKIADLSALAGSTQPLNAACSSTAPSNAKQIADANGLRAGDVFEAKYGRWAPGAGVPLEQFFAAADVSKSNACHVEVQRNVSYFFIFSASGHKSRWIGAKATALVSGDPVATVLVRSTLASLNGGMLNTLLSAVLGTQVNLTAASWQGIAKLNVNLLKVFDSLLGVNANIGDYEALLNTQVKLADLLKAMITAIEPGKFVAADVAALQQLSLLNVGNVQVRLGDLIKLENANPAAALNLGVNALELIQGALQVATKHNAVNLNLGIPGLVTVKLKVIEPAQLAIIGNPLDDRITIEARTAQVRLWVALSTSTSPVASIVNTVLGLVVDLLKLVLSLLVDVEVLPEFRNLNQLKLDVLVDVARGYVRIKDVDCTSATHSMDLHVEKAGVDVYVGQLAGATQALQEQQAFGSSIPQVKPLTIIDIGSRVCVVLGLICGPRTEGSQGNIRLGGHLKVLSEQQTVRFSGDEINKFGVVDDAADQRIYHTVLPKNISSISGLLKGANLIEVNIGASVTGAQKLSLVNALLQNVLTPVLSILDPLAPLLDGLLRALGIQVNEMEVAPYLQCGGSSELVY
nr:TadG family pilus assembly protein [uncultured Comamonas sp.]